MPDTHAADFKTLRLKAHMTQQEAAALFSVTSRTVRNWETGKAPQAALIAIGMLAGDLAPIGQAWTGFRILPDCLINETENLYATPGDIRALPYLYQAAGIERRKKP